MSVGKPQAASSDRRSSTAGGAPAGAGRLIQDLRQARGVQRVHEELRGREADRLSHSVPVPIVDISKRSCLRVALTSLAFFYNPQRRCDRAQHCHDCKESDQ